MGISSLRELFQAAEVQFVFSRNTTSAVEVLAPKPPDQIELKRGEKFVKEEFQASLDQIGQLYTSLKGRHWINFPGKWWDTFQIRQIVKKLSPKISESIQKREEIKNAYDALNKAERNALEGCLTDESVKISDSLTLTNKHEILYLKELSQGWTEFKTKFDTFSEDFNKMSYGERLKIRQIIRQLTEQGYSLINRITLKEITEIEINETEFKHFTLLFEDVSEELDQETNEKIGVLSQELDHFWLFELNKIDPNNSKTWILNNIPKDSQIAKMLTSKENANHTDEICRQLIEGVKERRNTWIEDTNYLKLQKLFPPAKIEQHRGNIQELLNHDDKLQQYLGKHIARNITMREVRALRWMFNAYISSPNAQVQIKKSIEGFTEQFNKEKHNWSDAKRTFIREAIDGLPSPINDLKQVNEQFKETGIQFNDFTQVFYFKKILFPKFDRAKTQFVEKIAPLKLEDLKEIETLLYAKKSLALWNKDFNSYGISFTTPREFMQFMQIVRLHIKGKEDESLLEGLADDSQRALVKRKVDGIDPDDRKAIILAAPLMKGVTDGSHRAAIISAIEMIQLHLQVDVVAKVAKQMKGATNGPLIARVIKVTYLIPVSHRTDEVIKSVIALMEGITGSESIIINAIKNNLSQTQRAGVILNASTLMKNVTDSDQKVAILNAIAEISPGQQADLAAQVAEQMKDATNGHHIANVLRITHTIPQKDRTEGVINSIVSLLKGTTNKTQIPNILKMITLTPPEDREKAVLYLSKNPIDAKALFSHLADSDDTFMQRLSSYFSSEIDKSKESQTVEFKQFALIVRSHLKEKAVDLILEGLTDESQRALVKRKTDELSPDKWKAIILAAPLMKRVTSGLHRVAILDTILMIRPYRQVDVVAKVAHLVEDITDGHLIARVLKLANHISKSQRSDEVIKSAIALMDGVTESESVTINAILINLSQNQRTDVILNAGTQMKNITDGHQRIATLTAIAEISPDQQADLATKVTEQMKDTTNGYLIATVLRMAHLIPQNDRTKGVIKSIVSLLKGTSDESQMLPILTMLEKIPADKRADVILNAGTLMQNVTDSNQKVAILKAVAEISPDQQADLATKVTEQMKDTTNGHLIANVLRITHKIPQKDRTEGVIKRIVSLLKGVTDDSQRHEIFMAMMKIPNDQHAKVHSFLEGVTDGKQIATLLKVINKIPKNRLGDVLDITATLKKDISDGSQIASILMSVKDVPSTQCADVIAKATSILKNTTDKTQIRDILKMITLTPPEDREKAVLYLSNNPIDAKALFSHLADSDDTFMQRLSSYLSSELDKAKGSLIDFNTLSRWIIHNAESLKVTKSDPVYLEATDRTLARIKQFKSVGIPQNKAETLARGIQEHHSEWVQGFDHYRRLYATHQGDDPNVLYLSKKDTGLPLSIEMRRDGSILVLLKKHVIGTEHYLRASGSFKTVKTAFDLTNNKVVAISQVHLKSTEDQEEVIKELELGNRFGRLHYSKPTIHRATKNSGLKRVGDKIMTFTSDVAAGTFEEASGFDSQVKKQLFCDVAEDLQKMHKENYVHKDIKPANLLRTKDNRGMLHDFGISRQAKKGHYSSAGTQLYMPPELLRRQVSGDYDERSADIWSLGCTLYESLTGQRFADPDMFEELLLTTTGLQDEINRKIDRSNKINLETKQLLKQMLSVQPKSRLSADQVLSQLKTINFG